MKTLLRSKSGAKTVEQFLDPVHIQNAMAIRAVMMVKKVATALATSKASAIAKTNDIFAVDVVKMARLHLAYVMYERSIKKFAAMNVQDANLRTHMMSAFANFALKQLSQDSSLLF